jgi:hypothetical protein
MIGESLIGQYVVVRTYSAGVHAGILVAREGREVELTTARRLWFWAGAASLSELAQRGTSAPEKCTFSAAVDHIVLTEAIELISTTPAGRASIEAVKPWSA